MLIGSDISDRLHEIANVHVVQNVGLSSYTRFGIGGPALILSETADVQSFRALLGVVRENRWPHVIIGGGTNLIVSDSGFDGIVLRFIGDRIDVLQTTVRAEGGASLQAVVDRSIDAGLEGMETMTGIPGSLGAAIYGNAGAYGHSINERVECIHYTDGVAIHCLPGSQCEFEYRGSIFKKRKDWVILSAELAFKEGDRGELARKAGEIRTVRDAKYPPTMKCAGSIFKNCLFAQLPPGVQAQIPTSVVREGKVPSAWFLEQVGAKGVTRGDIHVATYHANLIYNGGNGIAADVVAIIRDLKSRVQDRFGFAIEEEVQYVGFEHAALTK